MTENLIVSVSGIRGIVGPALGPLEAMQFGAALADSLPEGPVVVGTDGRPSGSWLSQAAQAGLRARGRDVLDIGVAATPIAGSAIRRLSAAGGLHITASHNPAPYNGMKLFGGDGRVLTASAGERVRARFEAGMSRPVVHNLGGLRSEARDVASWHIADVAALASADGYADSIRSMSPRVLVDANGGAGGPAALRLLQALGAVAVAVHCEADGIFRHPPEPTLENVAGVGQLVVDHGCQLGAVLDPDSDRLALFDEKGFYIGEEFTLALAADFMLERRPGPLVVNLSTSRMNEDVAHRHGCAFFRSAVGEANVADAMLAHGAVLGGEGNGGVMDPRIGLVRDPFVGLALVLGLLAQRQTILSAAVACLPHYSIVKDKIPLDRNAMPLFLKRLESAFPSWKADRRDGLRLDGPTGWIQVRASNTEPIARIIAEAPDEATAHSWILQARSEL
jgi:phosphomannomutase